MKWAKEEVVRSPALRSSREANRSMRVEAASALQRARAQRSGALADSTCNTGGRTSITSTLLGNVPSLTSDRTVATTSLPRRTSSSTRASPSPRLAPMTSEVPIGPDGAGGVMLCLEWDWVVDGWAFWLGGRARSTMGKGRWVSGGSRGRGGLECRRKPTAGHRQVLASSPAAKLAGAGPEHLNRMPGDE